MRKSSHRHRRRPATTTTTRAARRRISDKIAVLRREGKNGKQAAGMAYSMENSGRLKSKGRYIHKRKSTSRSR